MASANVKVRLNPLSGAWRRGFGGVEREAQGRIRFPYRLPSKPWRGLACLMPVRGFPLTVGHDDRLRYVDHGDREGNISLSYDLSDDGLIQMPPSLRVFVKGLL